MNLRRAMYMSLKHTVEPDFVVPGEDWVFKCNAFLGIALAQTGDQMMAWEDQSGNGNHLTPTTGPVYVASGINGKPSVDTSSGGFTSPAIALTERTYYVVVQPKGYAADSFSSLIYQNSGSGYQLYLPNGSGGTGPINNYMGAVFASGLSYTIGQPMLIKDVMKADNTNQITVNGVAGTLNNNYPLIEATTPFIVGDAGVAANVLFGFVGVYNGVPAPELDTAIQNKLKALFELSY